MKQLKKKGWTEKQISRLPKDGYWLYFFDSDFYHEVTGYCIMNGYIKYVRSDIRWEWSTLLWTCCPTKNMINNPSEHERYEYFETFDEMITKHPELLPNFHIKPINDF